MRLPDKLPVTGDRLWLVWRDHEGSQVRLLGGGRVQFSPRGQLLWTNADAPGVRDVAVGLGYGGPTNMSFLLVEPVSLALAAPVVDLENVLAKLHPALPAQVERLKQLLPL